MNDYDEMEMEAHLEEIRGMGERELDRHYTATDEQMLSSLLAVIHRDGGHYEQEHGTKKATEDAKATIAAQQQQIAALAEALNGIIEWVDSGRHEAWWIESEFKGGHDFDKARAALAALPAAAK